MVSCVPQVRIPANYTLIAIGPAKLSIAEGSVRVFGAELREGVSIFVEPTRALPLYAQENATVNVEEGSFAFHFGDTIPKEWYTLAEEISSIGARRILIIGDVDSGKTSLATLLVNYLVKSRNRVALIDADVGQKSVGPPGTIGLGITEQEVYSITTIPLYDAFFIGSNSPASIIYRSISGVNLLARKAEKISNHIVVDTTGWTTEPEGRELKFFKALLLEPDLVILVGSSSQLAQIERSLGSLFKVQRVPKPQVVLGRDKQDRREYRKYVYAKHFTGASVRTTSFEKIRTMYSFFFSGSELQPNELTKLQSLLNVEIFYAEKSDDHIGILVASQPAPQSLELLKGLFSVRHIRMLSGYELLHNIVGFMSREKYCEGIGIITGLNPRERRISVFTPLENIEDKLWLIGGLKINPSTFEEEAVLEKWSI